MTEGPGSPTGAQSSGGTREEIFVEVTRLFTGRVNIADGIAPPLAFVVVDALFGLVPAAIVGLSTAVAIVVWRLVRGKSLRFAIAGLGGTILAVLVALRSDSSTGFFIPGLVSGTATTAAIVLSNLVGRPFVAWTSWLMRGWPIDWYWHPQVRPAYLWASWIWAAFFATRTGAQWWLFSQDATTTLGVARVITGWPALFALLAATFVLGRRRLGTLAGPSVEEFVAGEPPPWRGQPTGF